MCIDRASAIDAYMRQKTSSHYLTRKPENGIRKVTKACFALGPLPACFTPEVSADVHVSVTPKFAMQSPGRITFAEPLATRKSIVQLELDTTQCRSCRDPQVVEYRKMQTIIRATSAVTCWLPGGEKGGGERRGEEEGGTCEKTLA